MRVCVWMLILSVRGEMQEADGAVDDDMHHVESKDDMFVDANDDMQENQFQEFDNGTQDQNDDVASSSSLDDLQALRAMLHKTAADKESNATQYKVQILSLIANTFIITDFKINFQFSMCACV